MDPNTRDLKRIISHLKKAAELADENDLTLDNGGEVGSVVGSLADELEVRLERAQAQAKGVR